MAAKTILIVEIGGTFSRPEIGRELERYVADDSKLETIIPFLKGNLEVGHGIVIDGALRAVRRFAEDDANSELSQPDPQSAHGTMSELLSVLWKQSITQQEIVKQNAELLAKLKAGERDQPASRQSDVTSNAAFEEAKRALNAELPPPAPTIDVAQVINAVKAGFMTFHDISKMVAKSKPEHEPAEVFSNWASSWTGKA